MRFLLATVAASIVISSLSAQPAKDVPLDTQYLRDHSETRGFMLGRPMRPYPTPDGKAVLFLRSGPRSAKLGLYEFDVASGKTRELLTPAQVLGGAEEKLTPEEKAARERMRVSVGGFTAFQLSEDGGRILLSLSGRLFLYGRQDGTIQELNVGKGTVLDPKFSPDGTMVSYVKDHDLYVVDVATNQERRLTTGGSAQLAHGTAEFIAQEEMARFTGYWWSPDAKEVIYQETDDKDVEVWYVSDPIRPGQAPTPFHYPRPGKNNATVRLGIVSAAGGPTAWIGWDHGKYPYLTTVRWSKGGPPLLCVQTRDQREIAVLKVDPKTGKAETLLTETDPAWVNIHQDVPRWLPDGSGFLWVSEQDEGPQLQVHGPGGKRSHVLVQARDGFQSIVAVVGEGKDAQLIYGAAHDPTEAHLYRIALGLWAEPAEKLTREKGLYAGVFAKNGSLWVQTARTMDAMPVSKVLKADGTVLGELPSVAEREPFAPHVEMVTVGERNFRAAVVLPRKFSPRKKYPVIVDVYGGPHHLHVQATRSRWLLDQWYADQGFIVAALDGRGTPGRGRDWERAIFKKFGSVPLEDQVAGLGALGERYPAMDLSRVGIDGWSFGGYMAGLAVMRRPDVFRAGVAGAPVVDWLDYDTHYTERYLGVPAKEDDPAYREGSLLTYAAGLKRPLMLLHGTADDNVYFRHSLKLVDALFRSGKDFEMVPLSGLTHMVPDPLVMERLHGRIAGFFRKHLGGQSRGNDE
jgi:dipeptidyl-peptidase-4